MKHIFTLIILAACAIQLRATDPITLNEFELNFIEGNLKEAKQRASEEGRLTFVEFYADWCTPCKMMERNVLNDDKISSFLDDNYVPVRINVDDFDGYAWKQHYNVSPLPTIIIFNSKGKIVERISEAVSVSRLYKVLEKHNTAKNKVAKKTAKRTKNVSPSTVRSQKQNNSTSKVSGSKYAVSGKRSGKSYKLQVGTFESYEGASIFYNDLKSKTVEPIIVLNDYDYGIVRYKVLLGDFNSEEEALPLKKTMKEKYSIDSFIY